MDLTSNVQATLPVKTVTYFYPRLGQAADYGSYVDGFIIMARPMVICIVIYMSWHCIDNYLSSNVFLCMKIP